MTKEWTKFVFPGNGLGEKYILPPEPWKLTFIKQIICPYFLYYVPKYDKHYLFVLVQNVQEMTKTLFAIEESQFWPLKQSCDPYNKFYEGKLSQNS